MKVRDLFDMMCSADLINFDLFEVNECVALHTDSDEMTRDDDLHEEWKNAEIVGWGYYSNSDGLVISVEK